MNKAKLKSYAPQARLDFIAAITARANLLGLSEKAGQLEVAPLQTQGDVALIAGQAWPAKVAVQREQLIARMHREGFAQTCESIAYTWFNRFAALRYMELHDYLGHGRRALSGAEGGLPDILTYAADLATGGDSGLPGLNLEVVTELKLAGNRDGELYRMLLVAQCNALSSAMPFLFERIDDDSELLLPDNLLRSDSVIAKLVSEIPEEDWTEVEIIGWLYQFYISEKKDHVIGKVVKSEDIPAATQLFTPNWIVQYLVQNSVGRLWLMANPQSTLAKDWPYYITPAEQTPEVQARLDALIHTRVREDGDTLNPESITVLDPACGSGHILVVAYDVLKAIYLERGYQPRAIPRLILEKNLYGLDIDDRAAQMAGFALLMKARADDRRLFTATDDAGNLQPPKLNVLSLQESKGLDAGNLTRTLQTIVENIDPKSSICLAGKQFAADDLFFESEAQANLGESIPVNALNHTIKAVVTSLITIFSDAKTFGSLILIPKHLNVKFSWLADLLSLVNKNDDLYAKLAAQDLMPLLTQAKYLNMQFDAVVANPPYMGSKGMNQTLKSYASIGYKDSRADLFAMFMERAFSWCKVSGFNSMVTMQSWMFLSSFEVMRENLLRDKTLSSMVHMGNNVMGIAFGTAATIFMNQHINKFVGNFSYCDSGDLNTFGIPIEFPVKNERLKTVMPDEFRKIRGSPLAYWVTENVRSIFFRCNKVEDFAETRIGLITGENEKYIRYWYEVPITNIGFNMDRDSAKESRLRWFPQSKGGDFKKWFGNNETVVDWKDDGSELQTRLHSSGTRTLAHNFNLDKIFEPAITWTKISSGNFAVRLQPKGFLFNDASANAFVDGAESRIAILGYLGTKLPGEFLKALNPTLNFLPGNISTLPVPSSIFKSESAQQTVNRLVELAKSDWDRFETSWDFDSPPILANQDMMTLEMAWKYFANICASSVSEMYGLEVENNRLYINAFGLQDEISPEIPESQITLTRADREKDCHRLISYAIGCMMGRYSLDEPGLIYAHSGNVGFEPSRYVTFPADADGIVPITDDLWFADDAPSRIREFLQAVWGQDTLEKNMLWLAESLGTKPGETSDETIRRYIADKFFKDHLQTYKKRPIYWLFSSGKQSAFQALVYLHRYSEGTLARMRAKYVVPHTSKIQSRIEMLEKDAGAASSTAARNKLAREVEMLKKKHVELLAYDEQLRHYADMRINLDLDDGVKVNYGKFGNLLAEVKTVTGGANDE